MRVPSYSRREAPLEVAFLMGLYLQIKYVERSLDASRHGLDTGRSGVERRGIRTLGGLACLVGARTVIDGAV